MIQVNESSWSQFNQAVCALRFLYTFTIKRDWSVQMIPFGKRPKKLPTVLGQDEVHDLIQCVDNPKHRAVLITLYAAGLRLAEATGLKLPDVDSQRMQLKINGGKGGKDRYVPISPRLLEELRTYWKIDRPATIFSLARQPDVPLSGATIQKAVRLATALARINKTVTPHTLRHSYATGLLEAGVDLMAISKLLGHSSFLTTMVYLHCRRQHLGRRAQPAGLAADASVSALGRSVATSPGERQAGSEPGPSPGQPAGLTVFSLLKQYTDPFVRKYQDRLSCHVESTLLRIGFCRTAAMKGHRYRCPKLHSRVNVYNSCTDRHCPQCMGARRADWVNKTSELLRAGTEYFQIVFTLPQNFRVWCWVTVKNFTACCFAVQPIRCSDPIAEECGMQAASTMVLHTWNQRLGHHPHIHALVPGSGPSLCGTRWVPCRYTKATRRKPARPFLVDNKELGRRFRDHYVRGVKRADQSWELQVKIQ
jgi:integrase/recombinase XerD